ncbi:MAG: DUF1559 domain-containing protein [Acidimicrobiales bacterium]|nr:DUF1559 domain-containing protein [Acidimicrobiales bacterium]MCB9393353.1 DUF1559 domain-containing protein [Acidimicrobiaceae bacterium]
MAAACAAGLASVTTAGCSSDLQRSALPVELSVGGPYRATPGQPVVLEAAVSLDGQAEVVHDLERIGAALAAYRDDHGTFPPAALSDAAGTPLLSWRVLLLPYLGDAAAALYDRVDLTRAWDDPANRPVLAEIPDAYAADWRTAGRDGDTAYAGVAGPKALFGWASASLGDGVLLHDVTDGANMTAAVGPVGAGVTIPWTAPDDVVVGDGTGLGDPDGFDAPGDVGTPLLFLDGAVRTMTDATEPSVVHSWATIAGDTCIPPEGVDMDFSVRWDLDADGKFEFAGDTAVVDAADGERTVRVQVVDDLGGVHIASTSVIGASS